MIELVPKVSKDGGVALRKLPYEGTKKLYRGRALAAQNPT